MNKRLLAFLVTTVTVTVATPGVASAAPTVTISNPTGVAVEGWLPFSVTATGSPDRVAAVRFYLDGVLLATQTGPSDRPTQPVWSFYAQLWDSRTVADGSHRLLVQATDATSHTSSASVDFTTANGAPVSCIPPNQFSAGDAALIQAQLVGPNARAVLCPGATYVLFDSIRFTAPGQRIYTLGFPTGPTRARLLLDTLQTATAVDGIDVAHVSLRNVQVIGPKADSAPVATNPDGVTVEALTLFGGEASDQFLDQVRLMDPHSWSATHFFEGSTCKNAVVTRNEVGPSGYENFAGADAWADGISFACRSSVVTDNVVFDATDGGIVVFAATGSLVARNQVTSHTRILLGGINLVDPTLAGNYAGTRVEANVIDARWGVRGAISVGLNTWGCDDVPLGDPAILKSGVVLGNQLSGANMGYGIPVNGTQGWTVSGNVSSATHSGTPTGCFGRPSAAPAFIQTNSPRNSGDTIQTGAVEGRVEYVPGLNLPVTTERILRVGAPVVLSGAAGSEAVYDFYVPPGTVSSAVTIGGGSGDADLYLRRDAPPTTTVYDCRPYTSTSSESCPTSGPVEGHYYVLVRGYTAFAGVTLGATLGTLLAPGGSVANVRGMRGDIDRLAQVSVAAGSHTVTVQTTGGTGDADLYVARSGTAGPGHYDCGSGGSTTNETCTLTVVGPATVSITVHPYTDFGAVTLRATVTP